MKRHIEANFNLSFLVFAIAGLALPQAAALPSWLVLACLATVVFISCFKIQTEEFRGLSWRHFLRFYTLRFLVFPPLLYAAAKTWTPAYSLPLLLLALAPPATSLAAMTVFLGGNGGLALALTLVGNVASVVAIPALLSRLKAGDVVLDSAGMFTALAFTVVLPMILALLLRRRSALKTFVAREGAFISILLIGLSFLVAIAKRRTLLLADPPELLWPLALASLAFGLFYGLGWLVATGCPRPEKITFGLASGTNNISLVVTIAVLYFPPRVAVFLIVSELPWILALLPYKKFVRGVA